MSEIDPELSASWRAASREQPPAALDDVIRAAARREVRAKPGRLRAAPRWWPLAAAATVAAIAVGIVQMAPPDQVTPAAFPRAVDAVRQDVKPDIAKPVEDALKRDTVVGAAPEAPRDTPREEATPFAKEQSGGPADEKKRDAVSSAGRFAAPPNSLFQEKKTTPQAPAQRAEEASEREQTSKQKTELAAASSVARQRSDLASPPTTSTPRNELQPFPASPAPADPGASNAPAPTIAAAPAASPAAAPAPPPPLAARTLAAQSSATGARSSSVAASVAGNIASRSAVTSNAEPAVAKDSDALGKVASTEADKAAPERRNDAAPLAPDEWIKRIRRLIAEGRNEDAAKELAAFRREYKERADSLLPSDLRTFRQ